MTDKQLLIKEIGISFHFRLVRKVFFNFLHFFFILCGSASTDFYSIPTMSVRGSKRSTRRARDAREFTDGMGGWDGISKVSFKNLHTLLVYR